MLNTTLSSPVKTRPIPHYYATSVAEALSRYRGDDHIHVIYPERLRAAAMTFLNGLPGKVLYAVKSNPHPIVIETLWQSGVQCFDVASIREITLVKSLCPDAVLYLMHPIKSRQTIRTAYAQGVRDFSFDHADELLKILDETAYAPDLNLHLRLALPKSGGVMPLAGKFGATRIDAITLLQKVRPHAIKLGLCFHVGSQCLDMSAYDNAIAYCRDIVNTANIRIDSLDIGGGFPVAYPDMPIAPMAQYFEAISNALKTHEFDGLEILAEPGRALCATAGSTLARVELRKDNDLYLNDGTYGSLFDAGQFNWKFPVRLQRNRPPSPMKSKRAFRFFGPTCDSADTMNGPFLLPADVCEGDWIEIENLGAYGQTLATQFNGFYSDTTFIIEETLS